MTLEDKILSKGFTSVYIEPPENKNDSYFVLIYFDFVWTENNKSDKGKQEIKGKTEDEILENVNKFIEEYSTGHWILKLK